MVWKFLHNPDSNRSRLGLTLVAGIAITHYWAQIFNLGEVYGGGKIISASLLFGPMLGLLLPWLASMTQFYLGKYLLASNQKFPRLRKINSFLTYSFRPLTWLMVLQVIELSFFGDTPFQTQWGIFLILKTLLVLGTLFLWFWYSKRLGESVKLWPLNAFLSLLAGLGIPYLIFWGVFGLPMVG